MASEPTPAPTPDPGAPDRPGLDEGSSLPAAPEGQSDSAPANTAVAKPPVYKYRIRFRKGGPLRLLSHHDLLRTFERLLRRADVPFRSTQGFNPRPRLVFALSLPLGVIGQAEVLELELTAPLEPEELQARIAPQTPPGLSILDVRIIPPRVTAQVRALCYAVRVPADRLPALRTHLAEVLAAPTCQVERTRPPRRFLDIRPFLRALRLEESPTGEDAQLFMELWLLPSGTARPDEVLTAVGLADLCSDGPASAVLERTWLELQDEPPTPTPVEPS